MIEDSEDDARLILRQITEAGYQPIFKRVESSKGVLENLHTEVWDLVIADYSLPGFSGLDAVAIMKNEGIDLPFILVSGTIGEDLAVEAMKTGVHDYIMKNNLTRLVPAIERELREAAIREEKRRVEKERIQLVAKLGEALRIRDNFISMASHELKTPITSLKLQVQIMKRIYSDTVVSAESLERARKMVAASERQIMRLHYLVESLLDISRIRSGQFVLDKKETNITQLVRDIIDQFHEQIEEAHCTVEFNASEETVGNVDPNRLEEVVINLLMNAIKFGAGKLIRVAVKSIGDEAEITVQDFGLGIAKEDQAKIFKCFERLSPMENYPGLGLGLYIANQILAEHGGRIDLKSEARQGSTFTIRIPLQGSAKTPDSLSYLAG